MIFRQIELKQKRNNLINLLSENPTYFEEKESEYEAFFEVERNGLSSQDRENIKTVCLSVDVFRILRKKMSWSLFGLQQKFRMGSQLSSGPIKPQKRMTVGFLSKLKH